MISFIKNISNRFFKTFGYKIKCIRQLPQENLLGITKRYKVQTILDAGANKGQFALWSRKFFPESKIYSFEPVYANFKNLERIAREDERWDVFQVALSDICEDRQIFHHINHPSSSSFHESTNLELELFPETKDKILENVSCVTLDDWLNDSNVCLHDDILLKLDVQGHETQVLKGAEKLLHITSIVITEVIVESLYRGQARFVDIVNILAESGFHFHGVLEHGFDKDDSVVSLDAVFIKNVSK